MKDKIIYPGLKISDVEKIRGKWKLKEKHQDTTIDYAISEIYGLCKKIEQLLAELEKHRWRLLSEGLPKINTKVQMLYPKNHVIFGHLDERGWWDSNGKRVIAPPEKWKPITLPEQKKSKTLKCNKCEKILPPLEHGETESPFGYVCRKCFGLPSKS